MIPAESSSSRPVPPEVADSCRLPLMLLFVSGAVWTMIASAFALVASLKFHSPNFLADISWLTYGRVWPAAVNSALYGFAVQAGLGVAFWMICHMGRTKLEQRWLVTVGGMIWNLGVTVGVVGILAGDGTGFEGLDLPRYSAVLMLPGYLLMAVLGLLSFHRRREPVLYPSQWFILAALFWFPWIYVSANWLLLVWPVRGVAQAIIAWWYANNLRLVWMGLTGLAAIFYFIPKLTGRELHSRHLALLTFWAVMLFGSWYGIPPSAPVPAWLPAISTVASVLMLIPTLAALVNVKQTAGRLVPASSSFPSLPFISLGFCAFAIAIVMNVIGALPKLSQITNLTWFTPARTQVFSFGFFTLVMFGAIYRIAPQITDLEFSSPARIRLHLWLAVAGVVLVAAPLAVAGFVQGMKLQDPAVPFADITKATLPFLRASTLGELLITAGNIIFFANLTGLVRQFCAAKAAAAYAVVTEDLYKTAKA